MKLFFNYFMVTDLMTKMVDWQDFVCVQKRYCNAKKECQKRYQDILRFVPADTPLHNVCACQKLMENVMQNVGHAVPQDLQKHNIADCPNFQSGVRCCYENCEHYRENSDFIDAVQEMERLRALRDNFWACRYKIRTGATK